MRKIASYREKGIGKFTAGPLPILDVPEGAERAGLLRRHNVMGASRRGRVSADETEIGVA